MLTTEGEASVSSSRAVLLVVGWSYYANQLFHEQMKQLRLSKSHCSSGSVTEEGTNLWPLSPTFSSLLQKVHCGGLKQNGPQGLIYLNTCLHLEVVWEELGSAVLLEEVHHWGWALGF